MAQPAAVDRQLAVEPIVVVEVYFHSVAATGLVHEGDFEAAHQLLVIFFKRELIHEQFEILHCVYMSVDVAIGVLECVAGAFCGFGHHVQAALRGNAAFSVRNIVAYVTQL